MKIVEDIKIFISKNHYNITSHAQKNEKINRLVEESQ